MNNRECRGFTPEKKQRPTSADIDNVVSQQMMNRKRSKITYKTSKNEFIGWAKGNQDATRKEYYAGWSNEDFTELLSRLEKKESGG